MIRLCERHDFDTIYEIINDAAQAYQGVIPDDRWHEPYMPREALQREIDAGVRFWGYEEQGDLIGVMGIQDVKDVTLIRHAYVRTARRGQGIGSQMLAHLLSLAERPVLIGTWAAATWAIRFYEKHHFQLTSVAEKNRLLKRYWDIPERQVETSVVLRQVANGILPDGREFRLHPATADDAATMAYIHVDAWHAAYQGLVPQAFLDDFTYPLREKVFWEALSMGRGQNYIVLVDEVPCGLLTFEACRDEDLDPAHTGEVWGIYLLSDYWRLGLGRRLMRYAEQTLAAQGYEDIVLWVLADNTRGCRFYQALGYRRDGASKTYHLGKPLQGVRYRKSLAEY